LTISITRTKAMTIHSLLPAIIQQERSEVMVEEMIRACKILSWLWLERAGGEWERVWN